MIIGVHAWGDFKDFIIILSHGAFTFFIPKTFSRAFFQCFALFCIFAHLFPVLSTVGHFLNDLNSARLGEKDREIIGFFTIEPTGFKSQKAVIGTPRKNKSEFIYIYIYYIIQIMFYYIYTLKIASFQRN